MRDEKNYVHGAIMAYQDCADFMKKFVDELPSELEFFREAFQGLATGFQNKVDNAKFLASGGHHD